MTDVDLEVELKKWRDIARAQEKRFKKLAAAVQRLSLSLADLQKLDSLGVYDLELTNDRDPAADERKDHDS